MKRIDFVLFIAATFSSLAAGQQPVPEYVFLDGKIFTSDSAHPYVQALAIRGDRIVATGDSAKIKALAGTQTRQIDLSGRTVIPGINDAHYHLFVVPSNFELQFRGQDPTWQEVTERLAAAVGREPRGTLILGEPGPSVFDDPQATRASLDKLAPDHPVALRGLTGHYYILNSAALRMLGVKDNEPDPAGGRFVKLPGNGKLTGIALEYAAFHLHREMSEMAAEQEALQQTREFLNAAVRLGITTVQNMAIPVAPDRLVALYEKAPTPIRVRIIRFPLTNEKGPLAREGRTLAPRPSPLITFSGTKWILDGTPVERSSAMRKPYSDRPDSFGWMDFSELTGQCALILGRCDQEHD
jgi:predicted amidohydrolase YtcJ